MKLIPKIKQPSVMQIVKQALENKFLVSTVQDVIVKKALNKASEMLKKWYPSIYNYRTFNEKNQRRLRTTPAKFISTKKVFAYFNKDIRDECLE